MGRGGLRRSLRGATIAVAVATAVLAFSPAGASASTVFGANLAREANSPSRCVEFLFYWPYAPPTCSLESINLATGESSFPPAGEGVVSAVRVRVGPVTGPMQIAEEEALRKDNPGDPGHPTYACCKLVALSRVFTPVANSITTVPVNFRVKQDLAPEASGYYVDDHLSLSVLDPNVPVPANYDGNGNSSLGGWIPAWQTVGEERAGAGGLGPGFTVLFNADWDPIGGGGGGVPAAVRLPSRTATVRNGKALLPLVCQPTTACVGQLRLQNQQTTGAARAYLFAATGSAKAKPVTYASAKFTIPAGAKKIVKAKLTGRGRKLLKHRAKAKSWANVTIGGSTVSPVKITLEKAAAKN